MTQKNLPNKKLLILLGVLLFFLLILILVSVKQKQVQNQMTAPETTEETEDLTEEGQKPGTVQLPAPKIAPQLSFTSIATEPPQVNVPDRVLLYSFKSNYLPEEVIALGNKLGLTENKIEGNNVLVYNLNEQGKQAHLQFDLTNGSFSFLSYGNQMAVGQPGQPAATAARNFLAGLGVIDDTVTCGITYQRKEISSTTFVECHRDWQKTGMPILSFIGLVNIPDNQSLSDIRVGVVDDDSPDDPSIFNTTTGQNGKKRPDDFNTATVAVSDTGEILSITSNIRQVKTVSQVLADNLLSATEAFENLKAGTSDLTFIAPGSTYGVNWEQVFPNNQAVGSNANITDTLLTYLEQPGSAEGLKPMYLIRGTTQLSSGYPAKFLTAVSAVRKTVSEIYNSNGVVAAATAGPFEDETLKLGTFNPEQRPQVYMNEAAGCVPSASQLNPIITMAGIGMIGPWTINVPQGHKRGGNWYLVPFSYSPLPDIASVTAQFDALNIPGSKAEIRELDNLQNEWKKNQFCPLRTTGSSPTLHVYGKDGTSLKIKLGRELAYSNPEYHQGWNVAVGANNSLTINNLPSAYIYYEYKRVEFGRPEAGWVTGKKELENLAENIGKALQLNSDETNSLDFELNHAASSIDSDQLYVAPIGQSEVDQKVPLSVSDPSFKVARYHFYVGPASTDQMTASPALSPVERSANLIVELGAVAAK